MFTREEFMDGLRKIGVNEEFLAQEETDPGIIRYGFKDTADGATTFDCFEVDYEDGVVEITFQSDREAKDELDLLRYANKCNSITGANVYFIEDDLTLNTRITLMDVESVGEVMGNFLALRPVFIRADNEYFEDK